MDKWNRIRQQLEQLKKENLYRHMTIFDTAQTKEVTIEGHHMHLFSSNAYLDLCNDPVVKAETARALERYGAGSGGSRLTTGTTILHQKLEQTLAEFKHREAALIYNTGYMANVGILSALAGDGCIIYSDALNHASIIDGCRLSKGKTVVYAHNDMADLERKVQEHPGQPGIIVSDGVFSMDGDIVDLPGMVAVAEKYGLMTMIDEAHATGVIGETGRGTEEYYHMEGSVDILMGTLSKAVGAEGGFVCGSTMLVEYLLNRSRSFIFSTALAPMTVAAAECGLRRIMEEPQRVQKLQHNIRRFCQLLKERGIEVSSETAIVPVIIGDEGRAMEIMEELKQRGYYISAIRYPTVERGTARLRIALMSSHEEEELVGLADALGECI